MRSFNRSLPDDDEEEEETRGHRMKLLLFGIVGVLLVIFSIGLLYRLGYRDGWNDRAKRDSITSLTYRSTMVLKGAGVNR
jgi:hypothetical protein